MDIASAMLCDHATVREGLLHVLGGGITRIWRDSLPAPLGVALTLQLQMTQSEDAMPHEVRVDLWDRNKKSIAQAAAGVQYGGGARLEKGEHHLLQLALPLHQVGVEKYGRHELRINIDGGPVRVLSFWVLHPEEQQLPVL